LAIVELMRLRQLRPGLRLAGVLSVNGEFSPTVELKAAHNFVLSFASHVRRHRRL